MEPSDLFVSREIADPQLLERCRKILDEWSERIPFSPIKLLGSDAEFVSAIEHATYKTKVTSQIEKRWLQDHEEPYRGQQLPAKPLPKSSIDPWKFEFPPFADFSNHRRTEDVIETRRVYDCSTCRASGEVTCSDCAGSGQVDCHNCDGYGFNKCTECDGSGQIEQTRTKKRQAECSTCGGSGEQSMADMHGRPKQCIWCHGRGTVIEEYEEEYSIPCQDCASSGKITCDTCRGHGKVTCGDCDGSGKVTCSRCAGEKRVMSHTSVEAEEAPSSNEHHYISPSLPKFKKKDHPLSKLDGETAFKQDEKIKIASFAFSGSAAAAVLSEAVESCRASHSGHFLRQRIEVEACFIVEYRYRHEQKEYAIYLNPEHKLVEDLEGPIQSFIESTDVLAEKAFKEKHYEDAYRLITRGLCMDESTESEKNLRDQILQGLLFSYRTLALASWSGVAIIWCLGLASCLPSHFQISWWFVLSLIPLLTGVQFLSADLGVQLTGPKDRRTLAFLMGIAAFLSGAGIGDGAVGTSWISFALLTIVAGAFGLIRAEVREVRRKLEAHFATFPAPQALEAYVLKLDPNPRLLKHTKLALVFLIVVLAIQPTLYVVSEVKKSISVVALLQVTGDTVARTANVTVSWKDVQFSQASVELDKPTSLHVVIDRIGFGELVVSSPGYEDVHQRVFLFYGSHDLGEIKLIRSMGSVHVSSDLPQATFSIYSQGKLVTSGDVGQAATPLPTGKYTLTVSKGFAEESREINVERSKDTPVPLVVPRGTVTLTSKPLGGRLTLRRDGRSLVYGGSLPCTLTDVSEGKYDVEITYRGEVISHQIEVVNGNATTHEGILPFGNLKIAVIGAPKGATYKVLRDGQPESSGSLPSGLLELKVGEADVTVSDGISTQTKRMTVVAANETMASFTFAYGAASIASTPVGAKIELTGANRALISGVAPLKLPVLAVGRYDVRVSYKGTTISRQMDIHEEKTTDVDFAVPVGEVTVANVLPEGASFLLINKDGGNASFPEGITAGTACIVPVGQYTIEIRHNGIVEHRPVEVSAEAAITIDPLKDTGRLSVTANRPGAQITLRTNGNTAFTLYASAPTVFEALPYGSYNIDCRTDGGADSTTLTLNQKDQSAHLTIKRSFSQVFRNDRNLPNYYQRSRTFKKSYKEVWAAASKESTKGLLSFSPQKTDEKEGVIYTDIRINGTGGYTDSTLSVSLDHSCYHVFLITDLGTEVEVQLGTLAYTEYRRRINPNDPLSDREVFRTEISRGAASRPNQEILERVAKRLGY